jgi:hypothetical protein
VPVPYFLLFLCFRKATQEIFSELDETSSWSLIFLESFQRSKEETERGHRPPSHQGGVAQPLVVPPMCEDASVHFWRCPFAYKDPRREKPKDPINFPETHRYPPPSSTQDREGPEALPGTLPERGIATGGLLHRHACLRSNEWIVYLGLWVHSNS